MCPPHPSPGQSSSDHHWLVWEYKGLTPLPKFRTILRAILAPELPEDPLRSHSLTVRSLPHPQTAAGPKSTLINATAHHNKRFSHMFKVALSDHSPPVHSPEVRGPWGLYWGSAPPYSRAACCPHYCILGGPPASLPLHLCGCCSSCWANPLFSLSCKEILPPSRLRSNHPSPPPPGSPPGLCNSKISG